MFGPGATTSCAPHRPKIEYGIKRYVDEAKRLYGVLDKQLAGNAFAAGSDYTIADMSIFHGRRAMNGTLSTSPTSPTSSVGTTSSTPGPP